MGIDFTAVIDHGLSWNELMKRPSLLDEEWRKTDSELSRFAQSIYERSDRWGWDLSPGYSSMEEELFEETWVSFNSPTLYHGLVYRHGIEILNLERWWSFIANKQNEESIRRESKIFATQLKARKIVYLPDSAYQCSAATDLLFDGHTVDDMINWLNKNCGPPSLSISDIYKELDNSWEGDGYFIEYV